MIVCAAGHRHHTPGAGPYDSTTSRLRTQHPQWGVIAAYQDPATTTTTAILLQPTTRPAEQEANRPNIKGCCECCLARRLQLIAAHSGRGHNQNACARSAPHAWWGQPGAAANSGGGRVCRVGSLPTVPGS